MKDSKGHPAGKLSLEGRFVAFTLGHHSDFDQVLVNDQIVAAGRITFLNASNPTIKPGRNLGATPSEWQAHVIGFECYSEIFNPGPRPNRVYRHLAKGVTSRVTTSAGERFAVPVFGRRHARVLITPFATDNVEYCITGGQHLDGVKIGPVELSDGTDGLDAPYHGVELIGSFATPLVATKGTATTHTDREMARATGKHVGGTDSVELHEILTVWFGTVAEAGADCNVLIEVEVSGEQGVG